jgi:hypothetical protein
MTDAVTSTGGAWQQTRPYKFLTYLLGAIGVVIASVITDGISRAEWGMVIIAAAGAANVWLTANLPGFRKLKEVTAIIATAAALGVSYVTGGNISGAEWVNFIILCAATLGVIVVPNPTAAVGAGAPRGV